LQQRKRGRNNTYSNELSVATLSATLPWQKKAAVLDVAHLLPLKVAIQRGALMVTVAFESV
jgi:hypothetical protein